MSRPMKPISHKRRPADADWPAHSVVVIEPGSVSLSKLLPALTASNLRRQRVLLLHAETTEGYLKLIITDVARALELLEESGEFPHIRHCLSRLS